MRHKDDPSKTKALCKEPIVADLHQKQRAEWADNG
jgi:hypothetical protein